MTATRSDRALRADARRNRELIVGAARELIAERGADVPMEDVARRAKVGVATVYRRFPDRAALIRAVAMDSFGRVVDIARSAEDDEAGAWIALSRFVRQAAGELRLSTLLSLWFSATWAELRDDPENQRLRGVLLKILDRLVHQAKADGDLRADVETDDITSMLALLLRPIPGRQPDPGTPDRYLTILLDGLQARADPDRNPPG
ncbi:TetR/AcrR family transcriptional regulator [Kribbella sp. CA-247076]|uniref:TetR/AcrR family transcriptional regulator n=1 Tax=Kribbella sp. CA-247076 TaxID=3239941 RepID=UPI003D947F60